MRFDVYMLFDFVNRVRDRPVAPLLFQAFKGGENAESDEGVFLFDRLDVIFGLFNLQVPIMDFGKCHSYLDESRNHGSGGDKELSVKMYIHCYPSI